MYLQPRFSNYNQNCYYDAFDHYVCNNSAWDNWVRWVVLAVVIVLFFFIFIVCSCITSRRRRRMGQQPFYGTGWASRPGQAAPYYHNQHNQAAPPYSATSADNTYYGNTYNPPYNAHQQGGYELQSPTPAYTGNAGYAPPPGPPPAKQHDGIVR